MEDDEICKYCPWTCERSHSPGSLCEGAYCEEAKENMAEYMAENGED